MDEQVVRDLKAQLDRLQIGSSQAENEALLGNPPWLYSVEYMLEVARTVPDRVGAAALGRALLAGRMSQPDQ
jgi:hypothetical protein